MVQREDMEGGEEDIHCRERGGEVGRREIIHTCMYLILHSDWYADNCIAFALLIIVCNH